MRYFTKCSAAFHALLVGLDMYLASAPTVNDMLGRAVLSRTGPTVGNDDKGEIERRGGYQTSEGVDERVD